MVKKKMKTKNSNYLSSVNLISWFFSEWQLVFDHKELLHKHSIIF